MVARATTTSEPILNQLAPAPFLPPWTGADIYANDVRTATRGERVQSKPKLVQGKRF